MSETEGNHSVSGSSSSTADLGVSEASLELAERVALRLDIYDKPAIFNMLSSRAKLGAGIVTVSFLLWWLLISNSSSPGFQGPLIVGLTFKNLFEYGNFYDSLWIGITPITLCLRSLYYNKIDTDVILFGHQIHSRNVIWIELLLLNLLIEVNECILSDAT